MVSAADSKRLHIKLVDLGIVTVTNEPSFTAASAFLGSKHSAPLEQLTGEQLDCRADIYGAGAVLYSCYSGHAMYDSVGPEGAIVRKMMQEPDRLTVRSNAEAADHLLVNFVNKCIAVDRRSRPRSAQECLASLRGIRG